jgi:hypothetical protein
VCNISVIAHLAGQLSSNTFSESILAIWQTLAENIFPGASFVAREAPRFSVVPYCPKTWPVSKIKFFASCFCAFRRFESIRRLYGLKLLLSITAVRNSTGTTFAVTRMTLK